MKISKLYSKKYWKRKFFSKFGHYFPDAYMWYKAECFYCSVTNKSLNYHRPKDINEKLMWLSRYWRHPLKTLCADKYQVREYLKNLGYEELLVPLLGVWNSAEEIDFDLLPRQFVLKCNHGSGCNIICLDKTSLDISVVRKQLDVWLSIDYSTLAFELHYRDIPRKIIAEQLISNTAPIEYQFWCLNGEIDSVLVCRKNFDKTYDSESYSTEWKHLCERKNENELNTIFKKPSCWEELLKIAKDLSKPFPFVRVDLYVVDDKIFFAELTFTPAGNILLAYKDDFIKRLGNKLQLPPKYI